MNVTGACSVHVSASWSRGRSPVLAAMSSATCVLDPCFSWVIKASWEMAYDWIQVVFNASLQKWMVLSALKKAVFHFKKPFLNLTFLNNVCPMSYTSLFRKVVDMVVGAQLQRAPEEDLFQLEFRLSYSSEKILILYYEV